MRILHTDSQTSETILLVKNPNLTEIKEMMEEEESKSGDSRAIKETHGMIGFLAINSKQEVYIWFAPRRGHVTIWEEILHNHDDLYQNPDVLSGLARIEQNNLKPIDVVIDSPRWQWLRKYHFYIEH